MATRQALLISGPGDENSDTYLRGVFLDVRNYERHLLSPTGGAWGTNEITILHSPFPSDVRRWTQDHKDTDYTFIMYTGHGAYSLTDHDQILELRPGQRMLGQELRDTAKRRTVIMDSCQVYEQPLVKSRFDEAIAANAQQRTLDPERCRRKFFADVSEAPNAVVALHSCAKGESSYEDDETGGFYNSSMIGSIVDWVRTQSSSNGRDPAALSVIGAHNAATPKTTNRSEGRQHPTIIMRPKSGLIFPIAVYA